MAKTLLDLANSLEKKAKAIDKAASDLAIETAVEIVANLAFTTRVDTSTALSNWQVTLDNPATAEIEAHFKGKKGSTQRSSAAETIEAAKKVLGNKKPGQKIYISNVLSYIGWISEDGVKGGGIRGYYERASLIGSRMLKKFKVPRNG